MKKIIFIGTIGCGKTTLSQAILGEPLEYKKTQSVEVLGKSILDTPGEYLELGQMRGALTITASDAEVIGLVQSAIEDFNMFPPAYGGSFAKKVIGVVTKIDQATKQQVKAAEAKLKMAGAQHIFHVSSYTGKGMKELIEYLEE